MFKRLFWLRMKQGQNSFEIFYASHEPLMVSTVDTDSTDPVRSQTRPFFYLGEAEFTFLT
jgi:hypothetical protein